MMDAKVTTTKAAVAVVEVTKAAIPITALSLLRRRKNNNNDNDDETCKQSSLPTLPLLLSSSIIQHQQQQQQQQQQPSWFVLNSQYDKHNNNNNNNNGKIIEISGEAGSGKTQLCLSTCVTCVTTTTTTTATTTTATHNNNNNSNDDNDSSQQYFNAMYITMGSEGKQSKQIAQRLYQMIQHRIISSSTISSSNLLDKNIRSIMKRIHINHVHNEEDLLELVTMTLPKLLQKSNCGVGAGSGAGGSSTTSSSNRFGVIVLDSIAGIFRDYDTTTTTMNNYDQKNNHNSNDTNQQLTTSSSSSSSSSSFTKAKYYAKRSELFYTISSHLKKLSFTYNVHIIIVNQVTTDFIHNYYNHHHHKRRKMDHIDNNGVVRMKPALGLAWSYCVNDRFILSRCNKISCNSNSSSISGGSSSTTMNDILGGNNENHHENNDDSNKNTDCNIQSYARSLKLLASSRYSIHDKEVKFQIQPCGVVML